MSLQQAEARGRAYRASGVPTLIVNGKYRIETRGAGSTRDMLKVAEFLIQLERESCFPSGCIEALTPALRKVSL